MGSLSCAGQVIEFDDRLLAHLQVVIVQKFRARQPFLLSWIDPMAEGDGRSAVWLTPRAVLHFKFTEARSPAINREWLDRLMRSASSGTGLIVTEESGSLARAVSHHRVPQH